MTKKKNSQEYSAKHIKAVTPKEHLRERPNLVFGEETGSDEHPFSSMKSVALREIIDNSVSEAMLGVADYIKVIFHKDGSFTCQDNGRGIPIDIGQTAYGKPASGLYLALGLMQSGSSLKNDDKDRMVNSANGLGASATNFMSEYCRIIVHRDNKEVELDFLDGEPGFFADDTTNEFTKVKTLADLKVSKDKRSKVEKERRKTGTTVHLKLDDRLFYTEYPYDIDDLTRRIEGVTYLLPGLTCEVVNENILLEDDSYKTDVFYSEKGITELVEVNIGQNGITPIIGGSIKTEFVEKISKQLSYDRALHINFAFAYNNGFNYFLDSYVNSIRTTLGGVHCKAFEDALVNSFNRKFRLMKQGLSKSDSDPILKDYQEGLVAVLDFSTNVPRYVGQEKQRLGGTDLQKKAQKEIEAVLDEWVSSPKNMDVVRVIADKVITAMKNRTRIQELKEVERAKKSIERTSKMPVKLVDCEHTYHELSEFYICEGDSALSPLISARDSRYQALLPIRGKILNVLKASQKAILENQEIQDIIKCLDAGVGKDYNHENARYKKVIIATDQDPDGYAIANLLITACYTLFPELVERGCLYRVMTPLYIIKTAKQNYYCITAEERDEVISKLKNVRYEIVRAKGLGESGEEALYDTGMNPQTRTIQQITIEDIEKAKEMLEVVMGTEVPPRRKWIKENLITVQEEEVEIE